MSDYYRIISFGWFLIYQNKHILIAIVFRRVVIISSVGSF